MTRSAASREVITVLITDGEQRSSLAAARALGRSGYRVHVCSSEPNSLAGSSKYSDGESVVRDPLSNAAGYTADLLRVVKAQRADVLIPVSEASLLAVLPRRVDFPCMIPFASAEAFGRICDKQEVLRLGKQIGVAVPAQVEMMTPDSSLEGLSLGFPLVIKPSRSIAGAESERVRAGVRYARDEKELGRAIRNSPPSTFPLLLQQRIDGPGFAISILLWDGEVRAAFSHRRIREKPPSGGVSVMRESIPIDAGLLAKSVALLREFAWQGVAMVEFKLDARTGIPYLMEINGRLWGSLQLAIDAGVDFPSLLVNCAKDDNPEPISAYPAGIRSRWEWGEVDHLLARIFHPDKSLPGRVEPDGRGPFGDERPTRRGTTRLEVFRLEDPFPFVRETINWWTAR